MPRLYCKKHGREHEARVIEQREHYRQEGETVLIVQGKLISGPWLCDRCNAMLDAGAPAFLVSSDPHKIADELQDYDFGYERRYFAIEKANVLVYGAEWPGMMGRLINP